jgi:hypothetical protein
MSDAPGQDLVMRGVIVVELDDVVPRRHPELPNLYVDSTQSPIEERFQVLERRKGPEWIRDHIVRLREDLSVPTTELERSEAHARRRATGAHLRSQGYTVNQDTYIWCVYVIELDPAAVKDPGRGVVYVGETRRTPEERFEQHMSKARGSQGQRLFSPVVARWGTRLRMDLAPGGILFDARSAKHAEAEWAEHLRLLGYVVKGGH